MPERTYKTEAIKVSNSDNWRTPDWLFEQVNAEFDLELDICADDNNYKLPVYYTLEQDALRPECVWNMNGWANVPYSNPKPFIIKAYEQAMKYKRTHVLLVKADTSTNWWSEHALKASEIRFLKGRLKFADENNVEHYTAKWGSALLIFSYDQYLHDYRRVSWYEYRKGQPPVCLSKYNLQK